MSQPINEQPILSRSAKILFIGLAQSFIMGVVMAGVATSIMEAIDNSESADFTAMDFWYSNTDMLIYLLIGMLFFVTGSITLIVSGIVYLLDKRKGIKFVTPKNEPVDIKRQTIYSVIPILDVYAALKVRKLWIYVLIMTGISMATYPLDELKILPQTFPENVLIQEAMLIPIAIVIIRIFSKKWNKQFSENSGYEALDDNS